MALVVPQRDRGEHGTGPDRTGQDITRGLWQIKRGIYEKDRAFSFSFLL